VLGLIVGCSTTVWFYVQRGAYMDLRLQVVRVVGDDEKRCCKRGSGSLMLRILLSRCTSTILGVSSFST
jgi:hypothetical protein